MAREPKAQPDAEPAPETFRELVAIIDRPEADDEPATLNELISKGIAQANRDARHADSAALHQLSVRLGDLRIAMRDAVPAATGELSEALAIIAGLI